MTDNTTSTGQSGLTIPADVQAQHGDLIELIKQSESMNNEERQYWINILPVMTPDQIQNLKEILENEKHQLAAIDDKYSKQIEQIAQPNPQTAEDRRQRREELKKQELSDQGDDSADAILEKIQSA